MLRLVHSELPADLIAIGDRALLQSAAAELGMPLSIRDYAPDQRVSLRAAGELRSLHVPLAAPAQVGRLDPGNAQAVVAALACAADGCTDGRFDALLTLPVHKGVLNDGGIAGFTGHTEFFAERTGSSVLMLLVAGTLRVALATTHLPLRAVADAITTRSLQQRLTLLDAGLRKDFGTSQPRVAVLGLNPHAGENGHLGREEIDVIAPALGALRAQGLNLDGPLAADTAFVADRREHYDAYFAMYHDQGLTVLKALGFGAAVNITLGLPFVRTSVDHGVALDLAGRGVADAGSAFAAARLALDIAHRREILGSLPS